jgi:hypothetical protein
MTGMSVGPTRASTARRSARWRAMFCRGEARTCSPLPVEPFPLLPPSASAPSTSTASSRSAARTTWRRPGNIGRAVRVQWDDQHVRLLDLGDRPDCCASTSCARPPVGHRMLVAPRHPVADASRPTLELLARARTASASPPARSATMRCTAENAGGTGRAPHSWGCWRSPRSDGASTSVEAACARSRSTCRLADLSLREGSTCERRTPATPLALQARSIRSSAS